MHKLHTKVKVRVTIQKDYIGELSDKRINDAASTETASAAKLRKLEKLFQTSVERSGNTIARNNEPTTRSYYAEVTLKDALALLNKIDSGEPHTKEYYSKLEHYTSKLVELGDIASLAGDDKVKALRALKPYSFKAYMWQVTVYLTEESASDANIKMVHSKKHRRLQDMSPERVAGLLGVDLNNLHTNKSGGTDQAGLHNPTLIGDVSSSSVYNVDAN